MSAPAGSPAGQAACFRGAACSDVSSAPPVGAAALGFPQGRRSGAKDGHITTAAVGVPPPMAAQSCNSNINKNKQKQNKNDHNTCSSSMVIASPVRRWRSRAQLGEVIREPSRTDGRNITSQLMSLLAPARGRGSHQPPPRTAYKIAGRRVPTSADIEAANAAAAAADYYRTNAAAAASPAPPSAVLARIRARTGQLSAQALVQGAPAVPPAFPAPPPPKIVTAHGGAHPPCDDPFGTGAVCWRKALPRRPLLSLSGRGRMKAQT